MAPVDAVIGAADHVHALWVFLTDKHGWLVLAAAWVALVFATKGRAFLWTLRMQFGLAPIPSEYHPTFFIDAKPSEHALGRPRSRAPRTKWGQKAGYKKAPVLWAAEGGLVATLSHPLAVFSVVIGAAFLAAVVGTVLLVRWGLYRKVVGPLKVVGTTLGWGEKVDDWRRWLELPKVQWNRTPPLGVPAGAPKWIEAVGSHPAVVAVLSRLRLPYPHIPLSDPSAVVTVHYPPKEQVTESHRKLAEEYLTERLPGEWEVTWNDGKQLGQVKHPPTPPSYVGYDPTETTVYDVFNVPIGKDKHHEWYVIPLAELAPHTMLSAPTGYAKTSTLQSYIAHVASRGARVIILDPKRRSYIKAFRGVDGIVILTEPEAQAIGLEMFAEEMEWRYEMMERYPALDLEDADELVRFFTPWFLVIDEKATLTQDFKRLWQRQGGKGKPIQVDTEERILNLSRAALMHVVNASQQGNLETFGSSANRDNHTCRIASGPQGGQAWRMMFPGQPRQKTLAKKGRAIIGLGYEDLEEIQLRHSTREIARAEALKGVEVRNRDEAERNRRFREATGVSPEEAGRPVPYLPGSGQTWVSVPGHRDAGTPVDPYPSDNVLSELPKDANPRELIPLSAGGTTHPETFVRRRESAGTKDEYVFGLADAAKVLGHKPETFRKARQRAGGKVPGETTIDGRLAFRVIDLKEWDSQRQTPGQR